MPKNIYLDYAATTPVDPLVAEKMSQYLTKKGIFANPASRSHMPGWLAEEAVEAARRQVAALIGADPREIVWTSGATESDNLALKGLFEFYADTEKGIKNHIVTSQVEHKAILDTCHYLESKGARVTYLAPEPNGSISIDAVRSALTDQTLLVSLMHVNNETGAVNDIESIGNLLKGKDIFFHVDAAQGVARLPVDVDRMNIDLMSISAHKMYGPKGIGALYVRRSPAVRLVPLIHGGGHERGMRSGTLPTHQIVGMGLASELVGDCMEAEHERISALKQRLWRGLESIGGVHLNGDLAAGVAGILNVSVEGVDGEALLMALSDLAVSSGSACNSATVEPSYVLTALGVPRELALSALRLSLGRFTTEEDIDHAVSEITGAVNKLRGA